MVNKSYIPLFFSFLIWSSWIIPIRLLGINTITIAFFTTFFAAIFWGIIFLKKPDRLNKKSFFGLLLLSLFFVSNMLTYLAALKYTDAAVAVLTHYTAPLFVAFMAPFFLKENITKDKIFALMLSLAGFLTIFFKKTSISPTFFLGTILGLLSGLFYAFIIITAKKLLQDVEKNAVLFFQNFFGVFFLLFLFKEINFNISVKIYTLLFILSLLYSVVASNFYIRSLSKLEGTKVAIIGYIEPVGTILWGWVFFAESITIKTVVGALLILYSGYYVASLKSK